jgi:hypothetical protein
MMKNHEFQLLQRYYPYIKGGVFFQMIYQFLFEFPSDIMARNVTLDSFYVTCSSNKSREYFPDNKTSAFKTKLKEPLYLNNSDRRWEVGVSSFSYSQAIHNFGECMLMEMYIYDGRRIHTIPIIDAHVSNATEMANVIQASFTEYADSFKKNDDVSLDQFKAWIAKSKKRKFISESPHVFDSVPPRKKRMITAVNVDVGDMDRLLKLSIRKQKGEFFDGIVPRRKRDAAFVASNENAEMARLLRMSDGEFESEFIMRVSDLITQQCIRKIILICAGLAFVDEKNTQFDNIPMYYMYIALFLKFQIDKVWTSIRELVIWNHFSDDDLGNIKRNEFFHDYLRTKDPTLFSAYEEIMKFETLMMEYVLAENKGAVISSKVTLKYYDVLENMRKIIKHWDSSLFTADINSQIKRLMTNLKNSESVWYFKMGKFARTRKTGSEFESVHNIATYLKVLSLNTRSQVLSASTSMKLVLSDELFDILLKYIYLRGVLVQYGRGINSAFFNRFHAFMTSLRPVISISETMSAPELMQEISDKTEHLLVTINKAIGEVETEPVRIGMLAHHLQRGWWAFSETEAYKKRIRLLWQWFHRREKPIERHEQPGLQPTQSDPETPKMPVTSVVIPQTIGAGGNEMNIENGGSHSRAQSEQDTSAGGQSSNTQGHQHIDILTVNQSQPIATSRIMERRKSEESLMVSSKTSSAHDDRTDSDNDDNEETDYENISSNVSQGDVFILPSFYGLESLHSGKHDLGESRKHTGSPISALALQVKVVNGNKLEFQFDGNELDFAMSPSLLKATGFGQKADKYILSALNTRINLRQCLNLNDDALRMNLFQTSVHSKFMEQGSEKYFRKRNEENREQHYLSAGIEKNDFMRALRSKLSSENLTLSEFVKKVLMSEKEYMAYVLNVSRHARISIMDIVIYRLVSEMPFGQCSGDEPTNFNPSDLIFIYTNIIIPEDVDSERLRVLEIMSLRVKGASNMDQIEFSNTHYKKLDVDMLSDIEFVIATSLGTPVPFQFGPATIQLHFRRR